MLEKNNMQKLLGLFFQFPTQRFHIREIARELKISAPTVSTLVNRLVREGLLNRTKTKVLDEVKANFDSKEFRWHKRLYNITKLYDSNFIDFLEEQYGRPEAIVAFGSFSRGEDVEKSDIDIAIITKRQLKLNLNKFEKLFKRNISLHEIGLSKAGKEFLNNLANGIVLSGYLELL
jgi:predicted nucleotidyltransferase